VYVTAFVVVTFLCMLPVLLAHDLGPFWHDSVEYQSDRVTPFSVWGLWGHLGVLQHALQGALVALAVILAFKPAHRTPVQVAAFAGALLVALQMVTNYWLYSYIVWFFPAAIAAILASAPAPGAALEAQFLELEDRRGGAVNPPGPAPARSPAPAAAARWRG
jgi:hypothetical protein